MASEPSNELFDISGETHTQELKPASTNPLYDFLENEKVSENQTNGHSEDLLGMTDTNEVDLLGNSGPITSDDSGVTMDANNLDEANGDVILEKQNVEQQNVEQQNGESSEESDIQVGCFSFFFCKNQAFYTCTILRKKLMRLWCTYCI